MRILVAFGLVITLGIPSVAAAQDGGILASAEQLAEHTSAQAQPINETSIRQEAIAASAALQQPGFPQDGNQERRRSMARTWGGVGLIGAGIVTAFYSQECGTLGSLGSTATGSDGLLTYSISASSLQPREADGQCDIDFTVSGTVTGNYTGTVYGNVSGQFSSLTSDEMSVVRQTGVQGSAAARAFWPKGRMYAGLGIAAAGALMATVFANVDVPVALTRLDRSGVAVGTRLGW